MIRPTPIRQTAAHAPDQRAGDEYSAVGGEDAAEVGIGLPGCGEPVRSQCGDAKSHPPQTTVFPHALPDEPRPADFGDRGEGEQCDGLSDDHADTSAANPRC
jgi:hypothetical protein